MNKQQFLASHRQYVEGMGRVFKELSEHRFTLTSQELAQQFSEEEHRRIEDLDRILHQLEYSGEEFKEEGRVTRFWFAKRMINMLGDEDLTDLTTRGPTIYVPNFVSGVLEPVLVQDAYTHEGGIRIMTFKDLFYISSSGDHNIITLASGQSRPNGSELSARIVADSFEVYEVAGRFNLR